MIIKIGNNLLDLYTRKRIKELHEREPDTIINKEGEPYLPRELEERMSVLLDKVSTDDTEYGFEFAFITDTHAIDDSFPDREGRGDLTCRTVAEFSHLKNMDVAIHGGDLTYDYVPKPDFLRNLHRNIKEMRRVINAPVMIAQGNHDTGDDYYWDQFDWGGWSGEPPTPDKVVSPEEWAELMGYDPSFVYGDYSKSYYYKDFTEKKTRVIVLNTNDTWFLDNQGRVKYNRTEHGPTAYGFKQEQLDWLADEALQIDEEGWSVIVVAHADFDRLHPTRPVTNGEIVMKILAARKNNQTYNSEPTTGELGQSVSVDYTTDTSIDLIGVFHGHRHEDRIQETEGIKVVSTLWGRNPDDDFNGTWDYVCIDKNTKTVNLKRFGSRGQDRSFTY